jgi:hypothetical protein
MILRHPKWQWACSRMGWTRCKRRSSTFVFFCLPGTLTDLGLATDIKVCPDIIRVPAIVERHQMTSYNLPAEAHQELTYEAEQKKLREAEKLAEVKKKIEEAHAVESHEEGLGAGMNLAEQVLVEEDEAEEGEEERVVKSIPDRKTKSQKNKAKRFLAEVCSIPCPSATLTFS